jgi:hypothetical protein
VAPIGVGHGVNSPGWSPPEKRDPRFRLQADNQIIGRFDAISMLCVNAVSVLANLRRRFAPVGRLKAVLTRGDLAFGCRVQGRGRLVTGRCIPAGGHEGQRDARRWPYGSAYGGLAVGGYAHLVAVAARVITGNSSRREAGWPRGYHIADGPHNAKVRRHVRDLRTPCPRRAGE